MSLNLQSLKIQYKPLFTPPLKEVAEGLNGNPQLVEVGGPPYLLPLVQIKKIYDLRDVAKVCKVNPAFIIGAGAGPHPYAKSNCECIMNVSIDGDEVDQQTRIAKIDERTDSAILEKLPNSETRFALLANLFVCEGKEGQVCFIQNCYKCIVYVSQVLKVHVKKRTGSEDFITTIRTALANHYGDKIIGLGGTFLVKEGKVKQHVMPDFSKTPLNSDDDLLHWLRFFNMSAPLVATGTLVTGDHDLDLRVQHFHSFSQHGEGGHYHIDTTPETVEYLGYFNLGESIYRIDRPDVTHQIGRD
ncbi:hypothetical protein FQA39_LY13929 [Lamprigera yunnana]|nr:hypothetical protein FQA39_LY13929 [Lamprigera yunnana]